MRLRLFVFLVALGAPAMVPTVADALPSFARKYKTSCVTCHHAFPRLNSFGTAYRNNGYRFPHGQDPVMTKEEPLRIGAEGYKRVWPKGIWPADIAGATPISMAAQGTFGYLGEKKIATFEIPRSMEMLFGGTVGEDLSYFGEVELEHASELSYNFRFQYDRSPGFHVKAGSVGLETTPSPPTQEDRSLVLAPYNIGVLFNQSETWSMNEGAGGGVELWGAIDGPEGKGGLTYAIGVGNGHSDEENIDLDKGKDVYLRFTYKLGGAGEAGGRIGHAGTGQVFYLDDSIRFGGFAYRGSGVDELGDTDRFYVLGGDVEWWIRRLILGAGTMRMKSTYLNAVRESVAMFVESLYVIHPWLIGYVRYEYAKLDISSVGAEAETTLVPAVVIVARANVKLTLESRATLDEKRRGSGDVGVRLDFAF